MIKYLNKISSKKEGVPYEEAYNLEEFDLKAEIANESLIEVIDRHQGLDGVLTELVEQDVFNLLYEAVLPESPKTVSTVIFTQLFFAREYMFEDSVQSFIDLVQSGIFAVTTLELAVENYIDVPESFIKAMEVQVPKPILEVLVKRINPPLIGADTEESLELFKKQIHAVSSENTTIDLGNLLDDMDISLN